MNKLMFEDIGKYRIDSDKSKPIESPVNKKFDELFEKSEDKLKKELNEYNLAYQNASKFYVK